MKSIVLLTSKNNEGYVHDDHLFEAELRNRGYAPEVQAWEELQDNGQDLFLVRTTWNYTEHLDAFLAKLALVEGRLWNPLPLIKWNADKRYLLELADKGLWVAPVCLASDRDSLVQAMQKLGGNEFIVKPPVGASARGVTRFRSDELPSIQTEMLVQRFHQEIFTGEISLIYFAGRFAWAAKKTPKQGDIRVQEEFGGHLEAYQPTAAELAAADAILAAIPEKWLYARVDFIAGVGLIELECIEPGLFFKTCSDGPAKMIAAIESMVFDAK